MIEIIKSGLLSTIQDAGRYGYQKDGVIVSGAMDQVAHRVANMLVGNNQEEATMEVTMLGPELLFHDDHLLSVCGGDLSPSVNGEKVSRWKPVLVKKGSKLTFGKLKTGARSYIAVAGGFNVPSVLGSKSTYLRASLGGFKGRALDTGDKIPVGKKTIISREMISVLEKQITKKGFHEMRWGAERTFSHYYPSEPIVRVMRGKEFDLFSETSQKELWHSPFRVTPQSDRMGYRMQGEKLTLKQSADLVSEAVAMGTIQVPADGNPIILMADRQTTGGYPKIAQVAGADLPVIAQLRPGKSVFFQEITLQQAQLLYIRLENKLAYLEKSIHLKMR